MDVRGAGNFSSSFKELNLSQGETALVLEYNLVDELVTVVLSSRLGETFSEADKKTCKRMLAFEYALASDLPQGLARKLDMEK